MDDTASYLDDKHTAARRRFSGFSMVLMLILEVRLKRRDPLKVLNCFQMFSVQLISLGR